jgi:hypothetical protein
MKINNCFASVKSKTATRLYYSWPKNEFGLCFFSNDYLNRLRGLQGYIHVIITFFGDYRPFSAEKMAFFLRNNGMKISLCLNSSNWSLKNREILLQLCWRKFSLLGVNIIISKIHPPHKNWRRIGVFLQKFDHNISFREKRKFKIPNPRSSAPCEAISSMKWKTLAEEISLHTIKSYKIRIRKNFFVPTSNWQFPEK